MNISKDEIEQAAIAQGAFFSFEGGWFAKGADYVYQRLEPLITELSMDKARRHNSQSSNTNNISKRTKSEYGSHHWFATLMAINLHTGEFLMENTPDEETLRIWGKNLYENCLELIAHKYEIDLRLKESQPKETDTPQSEVMTLEDAIQQNALDKRSFIDRMSLEEKQCYNTGFVFGFEMAESNYSQIRNALKQCQSDRDEAEQLEKELKHKKLEIKDLTEVNQVLVKRNVIQQDELLKMKEERGRYKEALEDIQGTHPTGSRDIHECWTEMHYTAEKALQSTEPNTKE